MSIKLSDRVNAVKPSPTLAIAAKAGQLKAEGKDIISLSVASRILTPQTISKPQPSKRLTQVSPNTRRLTERPR